MSGYIFVNPFTSCVTDRYQYNQCIIMETETETNMKICIEILLVVCATCCYIFVNPFSSCFTDHYLPQQYITMQTINRLYAIDAFSRHERLLPLTAIDAFSRKKKGPRLDACN